MKFNAKDGEVMTHKILNRDPKDEILKTFCLSDDGELGEGMMDEELQEIIDEAD